MLNRFNRPWLHFVVLGTGLYFLQNYLYPAPLPSVGPLPASRLQSLQQEWFSSTGRAPSEQQLESMVLAELDREILFREGLELDVHLYDPVVRQRLIQNMNFLRLAQDRDDEVVYQDALRMQLHLGDEVIKRRLIQVMEQVLLARRPPGQVTDAEIEQGYKQRREELRRPERYTLEHVYFTRERAAEVEALAAAIRAQDLTPAAAREYSSPFLPGYRFAAQTPAQLARNFGAAFVLNLQALEPEAGAWAGPVESTYGYHLVWVEVLEPARDAQLQEVQAQILRDLNIERRRQALQNAVVELRAGYEVVR